MCNAEAQDRLERFEINQISAPEQGVAVFRDYPDNAAIIIESPLTNLRFSSNVGGIVREMHEPDRGRYVLILDPYTQILVIDAPGYIQQRQRIGNPVAREVRYFEVKPEVSSGDLISVIFNVEPADAQLFVDGQETEINQTVQLAPGSVEVRLEREGYRTIEDVVDVSERNIQFNYNLSQVQQELVRIQTQPTRAEIYVDNARVGNSDARGVYEMFRFPGTYQLRVSADGYLPVQTVIEVTEDDTNEFSYTLDRNQGKLVLTVSPSNAIIRVNRQEQRLVNGTIDLVPGMHSLEISRENFDPYTENIRIERGKTENRSVALTPHTGNLQIIVSPSDAIVRLLNQGGREVLQWTGSQRQSNLPVGTYRLEVGTSGYDTKTVELRIIRDETKSMRMELDQVITERSSQLTYFPVGDRTHPEYSRSWLFSGEVMRLPSESFKKNYGSPYMVGGSVAVLQPVYSAIYIRLGIGALATGTAQPNVVNSSGTLWYLYGQTALGYRYGILRIEGHIAKGGFSLYDNFESEVRRQSLGYAGASAGLSFPIGIDIMLSYALYTEPEQKSIMGLQLSWRI